MVYPAWLYHRTEAPDGRLVACEDDAPSGEGWVTTPAAFDPHYVAPPPLAPAELTELMLRNGVPYIAFPAWRYHTSGEARLVETAEADALLDKAEWRDTPAPVAPPSVPVVVRPPAVDRKVKDKE